MTCLEWTLRDFKNVDPQKPNILNNDEEMEGWTQEGEEERGAFNWSMWMTLKTSTIGGFLL